MVYLQTREETAAVSAALTVNTQWVSATQVAVDRWLVRRDAQSIAGGRHKGREGVGLGCWLRAAAGRTASAHAGKRRCSKGCVFVVVEVCLFGPVTRLGAPLVPRLCVWVGGWVVPRLLVSFAFLHSPPCKLTECACWLCGVLLSCDRL